MTDENNDREDGELSNSDEEQNCASDNEKETKAVGRQSTLLRIDSPITCGRIANISSILRPSEVAARNEAAARYKATGEKDQNLSYSMFSSKSIEFSDDAENDEDNKNESDHSASSSLPQALGDITMDKLKNIDV